MGTSCAAPPRDIPRLFLGNISQSVTDEALHRALSNFGQVVELVRSHDYAHVSLRPTDKSQVTKLLSTLNKTKWGGLELKVENAKTHYLQKLEEDWCASNDHSDALLQEKDSNCKRIRFMTNVGGTVNDRHTLSDSVQFRGTHKDFTDEEGFIDGDDHFQDTFEKLFKDQGDYGDAETQSNSNRRSVCRAPNGDYEEPLKTINPALESTLALFGLDDDTGVANVKGHGQEEKRASKPCAKEQRLRPKTRCRDPTTDGISDEISEALKLASRMFPSENEESAYEKSRTWFENNRKNGLWRTLVKAPSGTDCVTDMSIKLIGRSHTRTARKETIPFQRKGLHRTLKCGGRVTS
eukprot:Plantae.Rhodophyta-Hildenbrandia_rubra.ctg8723.p1 GENE.Plantae.Rhodophyta-Hildenbrandia_rubra.ctg8723~~Plantae.Rhodophyta-Hildenbrandia_rubra.ctg8723.p1  ORF type:complete len:351 (+),score=41.58 Plantae.Rhodophyta-Hildenbrandia_rubra.ctg8723:184-1236(+)